MSWKVIVSLREKAKISVFELTGESYAGTGKMSGVRGQKRLSKNQSQNTYWRRYLLRLYGWRCGHTFVLNLTFSHTLGPELKRGDTLMLQTIINSFSPEQKQMTLDLLKPVWPHNTRLRFARAPLDQISSTRSQALPDAYPPPRL